jgi:hypothetical protein
MNDQTDNQGRRANEHGEKNIRAVADMLLAHGFAELDPPDVDPDRPEPLRAFKERMRTTLILPTPRRAFAANVVVCHGIHGDPFRAHFLAWRDGWPKPLAIMCKEQHTSGSAVEKLEYMYNTIWERFPCRCLVLLAGDGFKPGVRARGNHWPEKSGGKVARVFNGLSEMRCWLTDGSVYPPEPEPSLALT